MSTVKNTRVPNFTNSEKELLMTIIENQYSGIIEDKKMNRASSSQKEKAWEAIENQFNASSTTSIYINAINLKKCYENRKKELRKTLAEERKENILTGGGPPPKIKKGETDDILRSILNEKTLVGLYNRFDDDGDVSAIEYTQQDNSHIPIEYVYETEVENEEICTQGLQGTSMSTNVSDSGEVITISQTNTVNDWKKYTPEKLQTCISTPLRLTESKSGKNVSSEESKTPKKSSRRRPTTKIKPMTSSDIAKKYDLLLDKRLQLLNGQLKHMETENALIIRKHQLEIEILETELARKKNNN